MEMNVAVGLGVACAGWRLGHGGVQGGRVHRGDGGGAGGKGASYAAAAATAAGQRRRRRHYAWHRHGGGGGGDGVGAEGGNINGGVRVTGGDGGGDEDESPGDGHAHGLGGLIGTLASVASAVVMDDTIPRRGTLRAGVAGAGGRARVAAVPRPAPHPHRQPRGGAAHSVPHFSVQPEPLCVSFLSLKPPPTHPTKSASVELKSGGLV